MAAKTQKTKRSKADVEQEFFQMEQHIEQEKSVSSAKFEVAAHSNKSHRRSFRRQGFITHQ
jgi:hypothetical protein